jgi:hypothetical protein
LGTDLEIRPTVLPRDEFRTAFQAAKGTKAMADAQGGAGGSGAQAGQIDTVMHETRLFPPPAEFAAKARIGSMAAYQAMYDEAKADPIAFWKKLAGELHWFEPFTDVLRWN